MASPDRPKLIISFDDDEPGPADVAGEPPAEAPPPGPPEAFPPPQTPPATQVFPTVGGLSRPPVQVGGPGRVAGAGAAPGLNLGSVQARSLIAATAGIVLGWLVTEITGIAGGTAQSQAGMNFKAGLWVGVLGLAFAIVYTGWEHIEARNGEGVLLAARQAGPWGAGLGFIAGFLANVIFHSLLVEAIKSSSHALLYLARVLGWGIFGLGMGLTTAAIVRAREKLINGALGGVIGGGVGGLIFEYVGEHMHSETFSRLVGLLLVGAGIGLAIGFVETLRREAWFHVVGGGMTGKEFILYDVETKVGSSPKCEITLIKDPAIAPFHFIIMVGVGGARRTLRAYEGCQVTVNGTPVAQHQLRAGDTIGVGATSIAYAERTI